MVDQKNVLGHYNSLSRRALCAGGAASAVMLSGCVSDFTRNGIGEAALQRRAQISGLPGVRVWGDETPPDLGVALRAHLGNIGQVAPAVSIGADGRPHVDVLALSGGGTDGAFCAGLLVGWTERGDRPEFQIVTGVSAGAIVAPFAFLGSGYDRALTQIWTAYDLSQLVEFQGLGALFGGAAIVDATPLVDAIATYVTPRLLHAIAREYGRGRMLLVGTTNLDAQRPVVWNMGAIAASNHPDALDLFRHVIQASAAIPGLFPPVAIAVQADGSRYEEMHVDGGTTQDVFVSPFPVAYNAFDRFYRAPPQRRFFIVNNGKITPEPEVVMAQTLPIAARAISTLLKSQHLGDLNLIWRRAEESGAAFNLAAVPADFAVAGAKAGEPAYERALYNAGYAFGRNGGPWATRPPESGMLRESH